MLRNIYLTLVHFGIDPIKTLYAIKGIPYYFYNLLLLLKQKKKSVKKFPFGMPSIHTGDRFFDSGSTKGHYFHQDLLVASRIYINNPNVHVDVASRVDGFVAHVASFRPIEIFDVRPLSAVRIPNIKFKQVDLMKTIKDDLIEYCDSLSCLHAVEHFGLGRYGDIVNYDGYILGLDNLYLMLKKGGKFYFSVPIGIQRIDFDANRVFSISYLLKLFEGKYRIDYFSFVDDKGDFHKHESITEINELNNFGYIYGCGIFEMTKL